MLESPVPLRFAAHPGWALFLFLTEGAPGGPSPGLYASLELRPVGSEVAERWVSACWSGGPLWRSSLASGGGGGGWAEFEPVSGTLDRVLGAMLPVVGADCPGLAEEAVALLGDPAAYVLSAEVMWS